MLNIIRADFYRLVRGKALYITFFFIACFMALNIFANGQVYMGINTESIEQEMADAAVASGAPTGDYLRSSVDGLMYFGLPLIIAAACAMFSCGAAKNSIVTGMSRVKLYMSKWILSALVVIAAMLFYMVLGCVTATIIYGTQGWTSDYFLSLLKSFGSQVFVMTAYVSLGVALSFITRSSGAVTGLYFAILLVPSMVLTLLSQVYPNLQDLLKYDISIMMRLYSMFDALATEDIVRGFVMSALYIVVTTALGITVFKKAEVK